MTDDLPAFARGQRVRCKAPDHDGHTRAPHYVHGHDGEVVALRSPSALPDVIVASGGQRRLVTPIYAVRFEAAELFGSGGHSVTVELFEPYLEAAEVR